MSDIQAIRERHEAVEKSDMARFFYDAALQEQAHADRATLLSLLSASQARAEAADRRVRELNAQIVWAVETLQEINVSNYDHDDVCRLNDASVEVILGLCAEPTRTLKGATS